VFILVGGLLVLSLLLLCLTCYLDAKQTAAFANELLDDDEIKFIRLLTEVEDYNVHLTKLIKLAEAKGLDHETETELTRTFKQITELAQRAGNVTKRGTLTRLSTKIAIPDSESAGDTDTQASASAAVTIAEGLGLARHGLAS